MDASHLKIALCVAAGGALGALARYAFAIAATSLMGAQRAYLGTLALNVIGCFVAGFVLVLITRWFSDPTVPRAFLLIGVMGGFTTFSAFGLETVQLLNAGQWKIALAYVTSSILLGVFAAAAAMSLAYRLTAP